MNNDEYDYGYEAPRRRAAAPAQSARAKAAAPSGKPRAASGTSRSAATSAPATRRKPTGTVRAGEAHAGKPAQPRRPAGDGRRPVSDGRRPVRKRASRRRRTSPMLVLAYWLIAIGLAFAASFFLNEYVFDIVRVNGDAMYETMLSGDLALVTKFDYKEAAPEQYDIVAVRVGATGGVILRRVIAVPGQTVEMTGRETLVDGKALYEDYVPKTMNNYDQFPTKTLPIGKFYVCGDNRSEVSDSRSEAVGLVSEQDIVGRVRCVIWPFNHLRTF